MSITILNYHDQAFVDQINAEAAAVPKRRELPPKLPKHRLRDLTFLLF